MNTMLAAGLSNPYTVAGSPAAARTLLCITVFLLTGIPRASIKVGPIPFYLIDLFIALTLYYAFRTRASGLPRGPFTTYILAITLFAVLGECGAAIYSGDIVRPIYALTRTLLAISLAFSVPRIIRTPEDMSAVIRAASIGIGLTAFLMVLSSLALTRPFVANYVFSISWLEPASGSALRQLLPVDTSIRGRSLVGVSILSGAFINAFWPLIALSLRLPSTRGLWRNIALACSVVAPFGIIMSYSRGAILGLILVVCGLFFFGSERSRSSVLAGAFLTLLVFNAVGWDSDVFYFERVVERTTAAFNEPYKDEREWERIYAYSQPFEHALDNPTFLLVGEGTSINKTGIAAQQRGQATHAVFAMAYYSYGMVAALTYVLLVIVVFLRLFRETSRARPPGMVSPLYYQALFAGFLGISTWFLFGHAAISTPRGAMLLFVFLGLITAMRNVELWEINSSFRHYYR